MSTQTLGKFFMLAALVVVIVTIGFYLMNAPDRRNSGEKLSDAVNELPNGMDKAAQQLESRTPAQKLEDAAKDTSDDLRKTMNQQ
jgi:hypothetical protein